MNLLELLNEYREDEKKRVLSHLLKGIRIFVCAGQALSHL
ncbi:hypothetical protein Bandiella_01382 [Candidatus Bandiella woodruffii]|uniref:Uncharacterized protein n=1 Tax=Candidatus Bandiella euplotis TaxID=1664265 RepID=A0ABZ0UT36_9RICK|nr:hypothetical protein Bandiella_01382 [Candidatus Bandiella woodruffii]